MPFFILIIVFLVVLLMSIKADYDGTFESAAKIVIGKEGFYSNDPDDLGGETKFGISSKSYPNLNIKELTYDAAISIYKKDYWDKMIKISSATNLMVFDCAINQGLNFANSIASKYSASVLTDKYFLSVFALERKNRYDEIIKRKPKQTKFYSGWMNRLADIKLISENYINKTSGGLS